MKFRKKPVVIETVQWNVTIDSEEEIRLLGCEFSIRPDNPDYLIISTLEGQMQANPWDWIIKGVNGEFYPCKPDIFDKTYESIDTEFIAHARTDVPELARRLKLACEALREYAPLVDKNWVDPEYFNKLADELEAPLKDIK